MSQNKYFDIAFDTEKQCYVFCIYNQQGTLCRYSVLEDKASNQVAKYQDIETDLKEAQNAINKLSQISSTSSELIDETIKKALFDYALILLVKCFNSSIVRKTSLDFKKIFKGNEDLSNLYQKIYKIRNEKIAHSGDYMNSLILYFDPITNHPVELRFSHIKRLSGEQIISYDKLYQLVNYILEEVWNIKEKLYSKIINELKENGAKHYYSVSKNIDESTIVPTIEIDGQLISRNFLHPDIPAKKLDS